MMLCVAAALTLAACGNSGNSGGGGCDADNACDCGEVCEASKCTVLQCTGAADCGDGRVCIGNICYAIGAPTECAGGTTEGETTEGGTTETGSTETGTTTEGGTTGETEVPGSCAPCGETSECEDGLTCGPVGPSSHCTKTCAGDMDCLPGWTCYVAPDADSAAGSCVPGLFQCKDCLLEGCNDAAAPWCNASNGQCMAPFDQCQPCQGDGQCGAGNRCVGEGTQKACVPECGSGTCPANGTCQELESGISVCKWSTQGECCFGEECGGEVDPCTECGGATPHCTGTQCVECLNDTHCPAAQPKCQGGVCLEDVVGPECTGAKPHKDPATGECVECLNASHCNGKACKENKCETGGGGGECDTCVDPYPGCAEFQGQWVCVQCSNDEHCSGGTCNLESYTCTGPGGGANPPPDSGECQTEGCSGALTCDQTTGLCYDEAGNCDNVTMFCPNGGECVNFLELLGGGGGGGGLPIPAEGIPGACACNPGAIPFPPSQGDCPDGLTCGGFMSLLLSTLSGGTIAAVCEAGGI